MSPSAGLMLLQQIVPRLAAAIAKGAVKPVGCEDIEELQAEGVSIAAALLDSAEAKSKVVTPGNIVHYTMQAMKSGRRAGYAGRRDALCAAAALDGRVRLTSMDAEIGDDKDDDDVVTLHDVLASQAESPDSCAARRLDWDQALDTMDARMQGVLRATAEGQGPGELALQYGVTAARVCQVKEAAAERIAACWGGDPLTDAVKEPRWRKHVRVFQERRACRAG